MFLTIKIKLHLDLSIFMTDSLCLLKLSFNPNTTLKKIQNLSKQDQTSNRCDNIEQMEIWLDHSHSLI